MLAIPCSPPSISTNTPTGVSSIATMTSSWAQQDHAVAGDGLDFFPHFHRARLNRPLEGEPALAVLEPHAQHAAAAPQLLVIGVEERVLLQAPAEQRGGPRRQNGGACFLC
jgi:hypothetical protein